ncbi:hypothetical protein [Pseudalkalibacillus sp. NRS-1564]|uniref:hypothetical protein n=1 Tax=Pseudalkalibacillus sp. NRS-1564 TaxID=3233900 RepID=UPI003D2E8D92
MKFEFIEQFIEQKNKRNEKGQEYAKREQDAIEQVHALKFEYEKTIAESVKTDKPVDKKLDQLAAKIEAAEKLVERRTEERYLFSTIANEEISSDDVVDAFNSDFFSKFKEKKMEPVLERLLAVKKEFSEAVFAYNGVVKEFESERNAARAELGDSYHYKLKPIKFSSELEKEKYFITDRDLRALSYGEVPVGVTIDG